MEIQNENSEICKILDYYCKKKLTLKCYNLFTKEGHEAPRRNSNQHLNLDTNGEDA